MRVPRQADHSASAYPEPGFEKNAKPPTAVTPFIEILKFVYVLYKVNVLRAPFYPT